MIQITTRHCHRNMFILGDFGHEKVNIELSPHRLLHVTFTAASCISAAMEKQHVVHPDGGILFSYFFK